MTKHFWKTLCSKAAVLAVLPLLFAVAAVPARAQSAEIRSAGVYYIDGQPTDGINERYCNWDAKTISQAGQAAYKSGIVNVAAHQTSDPWDTSALIEYDQPYPSTTDPNKYPNHCLSLCFDVYCTNKPNGATTYSISFPLQTIQFEIAKYNNSKDIGSSETNPAVRTIMESIIDNQIVDTTVPAASQTNNLSDYMCAAYRCLGSTSDFNTTTSCPNPQYECVNSEAVSYDDIYQPQGHGQNCKDYYMYCCRSLNVAGQKYYFGAVCKKYNKDVESGTCTGAQEEADTVKADNHNTCATKSNGNNKFEYKGAETPCIVRSVGTGKGYNDPIRFCTSWDGSYEILGEFGKTNGQFGFRANVKTNYPGDNIAVEEINIDDTFIYPSDNQYPIQVDVTNVHTVRSTATVLGAITAVMATPYTVTYRLSKDSDVNIQVFDASHEVPVTNSQWNAAATQVSAISYNDSTNLMLRTPVRHLVDWQPRLGEGMKGSDKDVILQESESWDGRDDSGRLLPANNYLISIQAKSQDEWPGTDFSRAVTRQLSLDPLKLTDIVVQGLNKQSTAYARVNYVPTEASTVYFEIYTPGTTFISEYTRGFEPTGSRPVIANSTGNLVYSNHQQRNRGLSYPDKWDGLCHVTGGCQMIYPRGKVLPFTGHVWNSTTASTVCTNPIASGGNAGTVSGQNCVITFEEGAPMPDGDYVYVLWAEVPYTDNYFNGAACYPNAAGCGGAINCTGTNGSYSCSSRGTTCTTTGQPNPGGFNTPNCTGAFTGVKTQRYYTGHLPIERGVVDITIQPVSYATIGSSPTAYGLDPFIFKYSIAREATVNAYVKNTAGVIVKTLTNEGGNTNVAQQMNTLTWDGRDNNGRMVSSGTYMFVVETSDPMFPQSVKTQAASIFPVDLYRITDVSTTDVYGDSAAKATISYMLSKAMNVQINIYNKDVVVPVQNTTAGAQTITQETTTANVVGAPELPGLTSTAVPATVTGATLVTGDSVGATYYVYTTPVVTGNTYYYYRALKYVSAVTATTENYQVTEVVRVDGTTAPWPPRVCDRQTDAAYFTGGYVDPTKFPQCIYVNDTNFTNYPANPKAAEYNYTEGARQTLDVRLQPVKTFNRSALKAGDGVVNMEEWDAQYFYNPTPVSVADGGKNTLAAVQACKNQTDITKCPYEMIPDGTYPFYIAARTQEPVDVYYNQTTAVPFRNANEVLPQTGLYATDKPVYRINISRGPVYFIDGSVAVYPNAPQLYNVSSGPIFVPPYEINFSISRAATVEVAVVALQDGLCTTTRDPGASYSRLPYNNKAGDVCKFLSTMTIPNTANFDPNIVRKLYWDGTDNNGKYVKNGNYEIRLTAKNYPDEGLYQPTIKQLTLNVDLLKVYDLPEAEAYSINKRGVDMKVSYQISVPMKVAIQIFKPGTTIYDYTKGTLRDPSTGQEVTNIRDVLVRSIVGIRPSTTLIEELWDGTDYAQQGVPDGTYPFRFVTALNGADIDSITGEVLAGSDAAGSTDYKINYVADTYQYVNLHHATVAIGDGEFVCEDWERTVFFYPNPFKTATGTLEITKMPVPGKMSIKLYNLAGDLVREGGYTCVDAQNMSVTMGTSLQVSPDNNVSSTTYTGGMPSLRNAALRCFWDKTNDHGKRVARGVYFGLVDFRAQNGRQHCQKVVKILIPR